MTRVLATARGAYRAAFSSGPGYEPQPLGRHARDDRVGGYFLDFRAKTLAGPGKVLNARGEALSGSPTATAQRALGWWERHLDREPGALSAFLAEAGRLRASAEPRRDALLWRYAIDVPKYRLRPPWCSAMAQGQAASVFVRTHAATGDDAYAEAALAATLPLVAPDPRFGVVAAGLDGPVLEEYPSTPGSRVLNGWIYALWGVRDVALAFDRAAERVLFELSARELARSLGDYDTGWWSLYSTYPGPAPDLAKPFYHRLHVRQVAVMHRLTGDDRFAEAERSWRAYDRRRNAVRAVAGQARRLLLS
jgi:hypothetical protein